MVCAFVMPEVYARYRAAHKRSREKHVHYVDTMLCSAQDSAVSENLDLISTADAARILGVDRATVSRWSSEDLLPEARKLDAVGRVGGYKVFRRADVERLRDELEEAKTA